MCLLEGFTRRSASLNTSVRPQLCNVRLGDMSIISACTAFSHITRLIEGAKGASLFLFTEHCAPHVAEHLRVDNRQQGGTETDAVKLEKIADKRALQTAMRQRDTDPTPEDSRLHFTLTSVR